MADMIERLERRDEEALVLLRQHYGEYCYSILFHILRNHEDAEEALSDVWLRIWNSIPPARPKQLRAYLAKTCRNMALDYIKRDQAKKRSGMTLLLEEIAEVVSDSEWEHKEQNQALSAALNSFLHALRDEEQGVFLRRYWYGASIDELAKDYSCSASKISGMLFRTRKKLRKYLKKEGFWV
ncbi:MAG: sigma-70 family RNA polymerase sigma factor [Ruminococcaceae bacterium]|nr:sigma-70 family RNA polymerase sigma factor [Oscillospiraceae bacterium]